MKSATLRFAIALGLWVSLGGRAGADECAEAGQHLRIARRAIQVGDHARAIAELKASYEADGRPVTLIFLARTYAETGQLSMAIDLYRGYLEQVPASQRTFSVEGEIARLSKLLLAQH
ncbi:MAG: hypothetical protein ACXVCV_17550, partial [Polyangia bacterium]